MDLRNQRVGVCQFRPLLGDIEKNLSKHLEWIERGREGGADFLVFPELSLTGYRLRDLAGEVAVEADSPFWKPLQEASREMTLLVGFVEKDRDGVLYNSMALFKPGCTSPFIYRKLRLPNFGMFEEKRFFKAGEKLGICETVLGRTGLLVCRDFLFPSLAYCHFSQGVKVIICPSNAPLRGVEGEEFDSQRLWEDAAAAYSRFFSALVVYVNRTGFEDGYGFAGGSFVMEPGAKMVWKAPPLEETLGIVEFDKRCFARYEALSGYLKEEDHGQIRRFLLSEGR